MNYSKGKKWNWTEKYQETFQRIKTSVLFLTHFDQMAELILASDPSNGGIGAVLLYKDKLGCIKAVAHAS